VIAGKQMAAASAGVRVRLVGVEKRGKEIMPMMVGLVAGEGEGDSGCWRHTCGKEERKIGLGFCSGQNLTPARITTRVL